MHAAAGMPAQSTGRQKVSGRKRGLGVGVLGLVIAMFVVAASAHENAVGIMLLDKAAADTVEKALVDQGFKNAVVTHGEKVGIEAEAVEHNPAQTGFVPIPKRRIVEHAYAILISSNVG
ncbi:hypothetical protein ACFY13_49110 [Streptomyces mirabilis]|uniref:hypothetical protein n=1 Tax=Streptomyces mirabilis TaxID=68239 RepID=UPI00365FE573